MKEALSILSEMGSNDPNATLSQLGYTAATAQAKFPDYWRKWKEWNRADADFLKNNWFTAVANQLSWLWGGCNLYVGGMPGGVAQNGVPFTITDAIRMPFGDISGTGVFMGARFSSMLQVAAPAQWAGDPKLRNLLVSASKFLNTQGIFAYHEAGSASSMRLYGNKQQPFNDTSYESCGIHYFDPGEGSSLGEAGNIKADWFNTAGIIIERGTPSDLGNISAFGCGVAGVLIRGGALSDHWIKYISGDDNDWLVKLEPGIDGREPGCSGIVAKYKCESATIPEGQLHPHHKWTAQGLGYLTGQFSMDFLGGTYGSGHVKTAHLFYVDCRLKDGSPQAARFYVKGKGFGYAALLVDAYNGIGFNCPPDHTAWKAEYDALAGELFLNGDMRTRLELNNARKEAKRLQDYYGGLNDMTTAGNYQKEVALLDAKIAAVTPFPFKKNGAPMGYITNADWNAGKRFDFANALPAKPSSTGTTPPPSACTWVLGTPGAWSACVNGSQTRTTTYVPSIAGCVPATAKPSDRVETQACTTPPTGTLIATLNNFSNANAGYKQTVDWKAVRTIELTAVKATSLDSKFLFCSAAGARIVIAPDGAVWFGDTVLKPAGTVQVNMAVDVVLTLPSTDFTRIGDSNFTASVNGNAFVGSIAKIVVKQ